MSYHNFDRIISEEKSNMTILPSTSLRNQYNEISDQCKSTGEPIFLTKNGEGDLVVMSIEAYERQQKLLALKEKLLEIEFEQQNGAKYYSLEELEEAMRKVLKRD